MLCAHLNTTRCTISLNTNLDKIVCKGNYLISHSQILSKIDYICSAVKGFYMLKKIRKMMKNNKIKYLVLLISVLFVSFNASAQGIDGTWNGTLDLGSMKLNIVFNIAGDSCTMDSPDQGAKGIAAKIKYITPEMINVSIEYFGVQYSGMLVGEQITGTFTQMGHSFPLSLNRGELVRLRPQTPQPPYPYCTEDITFTNKTDTATLAGTITYPTNYKAGDNVPVVLMVTGSGLQNRDEELFEHKPFWVIADYLARHGVASLRYDDRGTGKSTGDPTNATSVTFMKDAQAGVEYLKSLGKFGKVGVLGHSEGGMIAFMLGAKNIPDFIVSLAGTGVKGDSLIVEQTNKIMNLQGSKELITVKEFREKMKNNPYNAWYNFFIDYNPCADIQKTECPVMAINGSKDVQVAAKSNLTTIKNLLPTPQNGLNMIKEYPNLNHLFQHSTTGDVSEYGEIEETISPEVLEDIAKWINKLPKQ